jgi:ABC-2 type transport system permease protein
MFAISVFFGMLAAAVGGWTGRRSLASGTTAIVMVVSFVAVGILPLIEGWGDAARAFPWHYYAGSDPVATGIHWGDLAVLGVASAVLAGLALVGVERRDLGAGEGSAGLVERLRSNALARRVLDRLEGSARISHIWVKTLSDHQTLVIVVGYIVVLIGIVMGPFYLSIDDALRDFMDQVPEAVLAMVGYADMGTPEGWYQTENFSLTIPIALIVVTAVMGSRAMAGEEADRTMGLLVANPVSRRRIVLEKTAAMVVATSLLGLLVFVGTMLGSLVANLDMNAVNVAATSVLAVLVALVFGGLALAIGGATGRRTVAIAATSGAALGLYIVNAFFPLNDSLAWLAKWTPFYYYLSADPLNTGMPWGHAALLAGLFGLLVAAAVVLFTRRDLRQAE